jgi:hypothetical protein
MDSLFVLLQQLYLLFEGVVLPLCILKDKVTIGNAGLLNECNAALSGKLFEILLVKGLNLLLKPTLLHSHIVHLDLEQL